MITTYYRHGAMATSNKARAIEIAENQGWKRLDWAEHIGDFYEARAKKEIIAEGIVTPESGWERTDEYTYYDHRKLVNG